MPLVSTFGNLSARAFGLGAYRAATAFSPSSLFSAGEQGVWYDPSDLTTMFEDAAGTIAVHTPGNGTADSPVGMILDKHLSLGSELITNGDFSNGTTGWSIYQASGVGTLTASGGVATLTNSAGTLYGTAYQAISTTVGAWYKVSGVIGPSTGVIYSGFRKSDASPPATNIVDFYGLNNALVPANTNVGGMFQATATTTYISIQTNGGGNSISFKNISVKAAAGNHATQSTSTARPTLSARYNLLTYSEQFDNAAWPKVDTSVTANQIVAPDGTTTADFLKEAATTNRHIVYQNVSSPVSTNYTFSVCAKAGTRSFISVLLNDVSGNIYATVFDLTNGVVASSNIVGSPTGTSNAISSLGSGWYRCTVKMTCASGNTFQIIGLSNTGTPSSFTFGSPNYTGDGTSGLYIWGADWRPTNDGVGLPAYQRIADANTYDSTGFPYYIKSDGVDDGLSTSNINWGTNRVTLNVGIRNLSSGADNAAIEFYNGTLSGAWSLNRSSASNWWKFYSNGGSGIDTTGAAQVIPFTEIITATGYTAGTTNVFRENGTQTGSNTATQGSGNYGTYPIWMLKRYNGTLLWAGRLYGAIARGASSTATEISNTETWLNGKTKAY